MVNGFDKNIEHAARSALYTRYTPNEWHNSCMTSYAESDINRNHSEHLRNDAIRLMRQTDEVTAQGQREAGRRLGERLTDLTFWRNELTIELEKCVAEYSLLSDMKRRTTKALDGLDAPLKIAEECLYFRENRQGIDKVHDIVERSLLNEVQNLKLSQEKLKNCLDQVRCGGMEKKQFIELRDIVLSFADQQNFVGIAWCPAFSRRRHHLQREYHWHRWRLSQIEQLQSWHQLLQRY